MKAFLSVTVLVALASAAVASDPASILFRRNVVQAAVAEPTSILFRRNVVQCDTQHQRCVETLA